MAKIGLIQVDNKMSPEIADRQDALIELAEACFREGADLVFFPEAFQYVHHREVRADRELLARIGEEWRARCSELAKKYHAYLVPWDYTLDGEGRVYNTSYILDRDGNEIGSYSKCNITHSEIKAGITPGCEYRTFDLDFGRIGIIICFDNYFPDAVASLGNKGAVLVLYPLYGDTLKPQWELKLRCRAADHSLYMASCQLDPFFDIAYTGLVDPEGEVIAKLDTVHSYRVVEVDTERIVRTNTAAISGFTGENLREYLHRCRNRKAAAALTEESTPVRSWNDIYFGNEP